MNELVQLDRAYRAIIEAKNVEEVKDIRDKAEALRLYAKQQKMGLEAQNAWAEIKIRAEKKAGEILKEMDRSKGGRPGNSIHHGLSFQESILEQGISIAASVRFQLIASLPLDKFERALSETKNNCEELTSSRILKIARRYIAGDKPIPSPINGKYRIIYADPPWKYNDNGLDDYGHAERHYPPMTIDELCSLNIKDISEDNSVLFIWVTSPMLEESFKVISSWGFKYKTSFVWDKVRHNHGHYNSVRHEFLLVATKGNCTPDVYKLFDSVQTIERDKKHSEKPKEFREIIDIIYLNGNRIELFARNKHDNWEVWGNELLV